jgi:RNAse (barnase) inhibitor barstar
VKVYEIDGENFSTLEEFYDEVSRVLVPGTSWGRNLDAFDDILHGGFGTPEDGFTFRWTNHDLSRQRLGYPATERQLELRLERCHPENRDHVRDDFVQARAHSGLTVFDWLVEIIDGHPTGFPKRGTVTLALA